MLLAAHCLSTLREQGRLPLILTRPSAPSIIHVVFNMLHTHSVWGCNHAEIFAAHKSQIKILIFVSLSVDLDLTGNFCISKKSLSVEQGRIKWKCGVKFYVVGFKKIAFELLACRQLLSIPDSDAPVGSTTNIL